MSRHTRSIEAIKRRNVKTCLKYGGRVDTLPIARFQSEHNLSNKQIKPVSNSNKQIICENIGHCEICGYEEHVQALVIHHRNHNRRDNRRENLCVLCANCHQLVHKNVIYPPEVKSMEYIR